MQSVSFREWMDFEIGLIALSLDIRESQGLLQDKVNGCFQMLQVSYSEESQADMSSEQKVQLFESLREKLVESWSHQKRGCALAERVVTIAHFGNIVLERNTVSKEEGDLSPIASPRERPGSGVPSPSLSPKGAEQKYIADEFKKISTEIEGILTARARDFFDGFDFFLSLIKRNKQKDAFRIVLKEEIERQMVVIQARYEEGDHAALFSKSKKEKLKRLITPVLRRAFDEALTTYIASENGKEKILKTKEDLFDQMMIECDALASRMTMKTAYEKNARTDEGILDVGEAEIDCYFENELATIYFDKLPIALQEAIYTDGEIREVLCSIKDQFKDLLIHHRKAFLGSSLARINHFCLFELIRGYTAPSGKPIFSDEEFVELVRDTELKRKRFPEDLDIWTYATIANGVQCKVQEKIAEVAKRDGHRGKRLRATIKEQYDEYKRDIKAFTAIAIELVDKIRQVDTADAPRVPFEASSYGAVFLDQMQFVEIDTYGPGASGSQVVDAFFTQEEIEALKLEMREKQRAEVDLSHEEIIAEARALFRKACMFRKATSSSGEEISIEVDKRVNQFMTSVAEKHSELLAKSESVYQTIKIKTMVEFIKSLTVDGTDSMYEDPSFKDVAKVFLARMVIKKDNIEVTEPELPLVFNDSFIIEKCKSFAIELQQRVEKQRRSYLEKEDATGAKRLAEAVIDNLAIPPFACVHLKEELQRMYVGFPDDTDVGSFEDFWVKFDKQMNSYLEQNMSDKTTATKAIGKFRTYFAIARHKAKLSSK